MSDVSAGDMPIEPAAAPPVDGLSNREVADVIGVDESTVRAKLRAENSAPEPEDTNDDSGGGDEAAENSAPADPVEEMPPIEDLAGTGANAPPMSENINNGNKADDATGANAPSHEPVTPAGERDLPFDVEHLGPLRRAVLDHLVDTDEPQSVAQILAAMPVGTTRGSGESAIKREFDAGRIERVSPGVYKLAPPKLPEAKPTPQPPPTPTDEATWFTALDGWINDPETWDRERFGPRPDEPGRRIPAGVVAKGVDRNRKRQERRREAEAAAAKRAAADATLRDQLIAATGGNIIRGPAIEDVAPIKLALEVVPLERILSAIRSKTDKKLYPGNEPAASWGERRFLKAIAENYCAAVIIPSMVDAWSKAGRAPARTARASSLPPAAQMPDDIDELRCLHDHEHAPPGPHNLPKPDAAPSAPDTAQKPADASELLPAVSSHPQTGKRIDGATAAA